MGWCFRDLAETLAGMDECAESATLLCEWDRSSWPPALNLVREQARVSARIRKREAEFQL